MEGWREYELSELLEYEQPSAYIVKSTNYDDSYSTPVLTAGKSFILGYTNETDGICTKHPLIVFDDFTTSTQYVDFSFKVKSSALKILHPNLQLVLPKFIFYRLQIINFDHSTHKRYWIQYYSKQKIKIPSLAAQERIVAKIEELFSEFDKTEETLRLTQIQLDLYKQSVLKYAFTIESNSISLEQACIRIFDGPFGSHLKSSDYIADGIRVVRLENIKDGWFDTSKRSFVSESKYETIKSHTVISGDLIMSTFLSDKVKVCKLPADIPFAVNKADCVGIRLKKGFSADFIQYFLLSRYVYRQLINNVHGATRPRVNTTQIKEISIPNIPLEQQVAIATNIEANLSICNNIEATIQQTQRQIESLRQSILKKAFEGKLV